MVTVKYLGKKSDIGRFGMITKGTVLSLTDREWEHVRTDERFKLTTEKPEGQAEVSADAAEQWRIDLNQKSLEELLDLATRMKNIKFRTGDKKATLVRAILVALGHERAEAAVNEPETDEKPETPKANKEGTVTSGGLSKDKDK
jgi:hypothetical protein